MIKLGDKQLPYMIFVRITANTNRSHIMVNQVLVSVTYLTVSPGYEHTQVPFVLIFLHKSSRTADVGTEKHGSLKLLQGDTRSQE